MVDGAGHGCTAEPVVDVYDRHAGCAAVQHSKQCRQPTETGTIPDAGRHRDHWGTHEPPNDAWEGALHSCNHHNDMSFLEPFAFGQQSMQTRHSDVIQGVGLIPQGFGRHSRLFGDLEVRGPCRHDQHNTASGRWRWLDVCNRSSQWMKSGVRNDTLYRRVGSLARTCDEKALSRRHQTFGDAGHLIWRLTGAVDDLWHALAKGTVMVNTREPDVFEGCPPEDINQLVLRLVNSDLAIFEALQNVAYQLVIHSTVEGFRIIQAGSLT